MADEISKEGEQPATKSVKSGTLDDRMENDTDTSENSVDKADAFYAVLMNRINASADWIDSFFMDERLEVEKGSSNLRLKLSGFTEKNKGVDFRVKAKLRLVLPNLSNKVHLLASSFLDDEKENQNLNYIDENEDENNNLYLSLRYFFMGEKNRNISLRTGARFSGISPEVYLGPRIRFSRKWNSWIFRFIEDVTYFTQDGWESSTSFDAEKPFTDSLFFRTNIVGKWYENEEGYFYSFNTDVYKVISNYQVLNYLLRTNFETYPSNRMKEVLIGVRYRQQFWKRWLFYEVTPQIAFRREDDYEPSPGITISIEGLFGKDFL